MQSRDMVAIQPDFDLYELQVSPYERVASMLLSLLTLVGLTVAILFILWLTSQIFANQAAVPVVMEDIGTGEGPLGGGMEMDAPMMEELGQQMEDEPAVEEMLAAVADAVATQQALLEDPALTEAIMGGRGGSTGDGRVPGVGGGPGGSGRARHWEVRFFEGNTLNTYARQLDYFGIELGVLMPDNKVIYATNLSKDRPTTRTGPADQERRYYLTWRTGELQQADRALLQKANVEAQGRLILKFLPQELEGRLAGMEKARAGNETVRATFFGVVPEGSGYKFYIVDQSYK